MNNEYSKVLNGDVHRTFTGPNCTTSWRPNDGTSRGRPWYIYQTCFLNSNYKYIKLTLKGYSRFSVVKNLVNGIMVKKHTLK